MSKLKMKPVWRENILGVIPSEVGGGVLYRDGFFVESFSFGRDKDLWAITGGNSNIVAYQTTRTREAKVLKVICEDCMGSGNEINWNDESCLPIGGTECQSCDGKGRCVELISEAKL